MKNKRGSVTIFVCLFFLTLVFLIFSFIEGAKRTAVRGATDALRGLWADSLLSEYDQNLQRRYCIFGFYGYPCDVSEKVDFYAEKIFSGKKYVTYDGCSVSLFDYSLVDVDLFKKQLVEAGKLAFTEKFIKPDKEVVPVQNGGQAASDREIFDQLPSAGNDRAFSLSSAVNWLKDGKSVADMVKKGSDGYFVSQYIFSYFKDLCDDRDLGRTYFKNEIEYLICGKQTDRANASGVRGRIVAVREAMNFLYLNKDPKKSGEAMAAAQLLTPGPAAVVTQKALLAAWALAESYNDYKLLINGHKVAVMKSEATWAVDLDSVIANKAEGYIYTGIEEGMDYQDYLKMLICAVDERIRILRIMDLIQINMRYMYYGTFLLREYNGGLRFTITVNGEEYETEKIY